MDIPIFDPNGPGPCVPPDLDDPGWLDDTSWLDNMEVQMVDVIDASKSAPEVPFCIDGSMITDSTFKMQRMATKADAIKPQYSLIPLDLLLDHIDRVTDTDPLNLKSTIFICHKLINDVIDDPVGSIQNLMEDMADKVGLAPACYALQYGVVKYARNNWKLGFGGDYKRLLEATIRHCLAQLKGEEYDGECLEGFPKGNLHLGAIYFSLMVACNEAHIHFHGKPRWGVKGDS